ncbi:MAG: DUF3606 domain-containing protein [Pseudomonadota bacterium]
MPDETDPRATPERIDTSRDPELRAWAKKLDATPEQIKEAVQAVGDRADEVEAHLKGVRSTTNRERVTRSSGGRG